MEFELKDKRVLISGASRGIGRAAALVFAAEGARVMVTGRTRRDVDDTVAEIRRKEGPSSADGFVGDLRQSIVVRRLGKRMRSVWGGLDVLVCNMGDGAGRPGMDLEESEWERLLDINLLSGVRLVRRVLPLLEKSPTPVLLFVSSLAGLEHVGAPLAYQSAKASLISFTKGLARRLAPMGARVNTVLPGNILSPGGPWDRKRISDPAFVRRLLRTEVPLQRFGRPEEVADALVFLASTRASFITGACLVVDGGQGRSFQ